MRTSRKVSVRYSISNTGSASRALTNASPRSCMSIKRCTWARSSTFAHAARSSFKVSGPKVVKINNPRGCRTRRASAKIASGGSHQCNIRLLKSRSTLWSRSGSRAASAHTRENLRNSRCWRTASLNMPWAISTATTCALGNFAFSAFAACAVPQPKSTTTAGCILTHSSRCSRRSRTSDCNAAAASLLRLARSKERRTARGSRSKGAADMLRPRGASPALR